MLYRLRLTYLSDGFVARAASAFAVGLFLREFPHVAHVLMVFCSKISRWSLVDLLDPFRFGDVHAEKLTEFVRRLQGGRPPTYGHIKGEITTVRSGDSDNPKSSTEQATGRETRDRARVLGNQDRLD